MRCRRSTVQGYACQVMTKDKYGKLIAFDACLAKELFWLWDRGVTTTGCCCGCHIGMRNNMSYIGVIQDDVEYMKSQGYKVRVNPMRPNDEDSFIPKTNLGVEN
jgi:hypothetical protein